MSDTTLARRHPAPYAAYGLARAYLLADLAYISVPQMLVPPKGNFQNNAEKKFTRIHEWYRARAEHFLGDLHEFEVVSNDYRGADFTFMRDCVTVLCSCINIRRCFDLAFPPYRPINHGP